MFMSVHGMPTYGAGAAATVVVTTVRVCVGGGGVIATVVDTAGGRLDVVGRGGGVDAGVVGVSVVGVFLDEMSPFPARVA